MTIQTWKEQAQQHFQDGNKALFSTFWELNKASDEKQVKNIAQHLVDHLSQAQSSITVDPNSIESYIEWSRSPISIDLKDKTNSISLHEPSTVDNVLHQDVSYALKRLIRGLSTKSTISRLGFTLSLAHLLKAFPIISLRTVIELVIRYHPKNNTSEERDNMIGDILAWTAIFKSELLKRSDHSTFFIKYILIDSIKQLKPYLREGLIILIMDIITQLSSKQLLQDLKSYIQSSSLDSIELYTLLFHITSLQNSNLNITNIESILLSSITTLPYLHPIWDGFLSCLVSSRLNISFSSFWSEFVQSRLFSNDTKEQQLALLLLGKIIQFPNISYSDVWTRSFTEKIVQILSNSNSHKHPLYETIKKLVQSLHTCPSLSKDDSILYSLENICIYIASIDGSIMKQTIPLLVSLLTDINPWIQFLQDVIYDTKYSTSIHMFAINQLSILAKKNSDIIQFLIKFIFSDSNHSESLLSFAKTQFWSLLSDLLSKDNCISILSNILDSIQSYDMLYDTKIFQTLHISSQVLLYGISIMGCMTRDPYYTTLINDIIANGQECLIDIWIKLLSIPESSTFYKHLVHSSIDLFGTIPLSFIDTVLSMIFASDDTIADSDDDISDDDTVVSDDCSGGDDDIEPISINDTEWTDEQMANVDRVLGQMFALKKTNAPTQIQVNQKLFSLLHQMILDNSLLNINHCVYMLNRIFESEAINVMEDWLIKTVFKCKYDSKSIDDLAITSLCDKIVNDYIMMNSNQNISYATFIFLSHIKGDMNYFKTFFDAFTMERTGKLKRVQVPSLFFLIDLVKQFPKKSFDILCPIILDYILNICTNGTTSRVTFLFSKILELLDAISKCSFEVNHSNIDPICEFQLKMLDCIEYKVILDNQLKELFRIMNHFIKRFKKTANDMETLRKRYSKLIDEWSTRPSSISKSCQDVIRQCYKTSS